MTEIDYCPKCDKLVRGVFDRCIECQSRTLKLYMATDGLGAFVLVCIGLGFVGFIAWMLLDFTDSFLVDIIVGAIILSCSAYVPAYFAYKKQKPVLDSTLERGRRLYSERKQEYDDGMKITDTEMPPAATQFPWSIRNVQGLRNALIVCIILVPIPMLLGIFVLRFDSVAEQLVSSFLTTAFITAAIMIYLGYGPAKRHFEVINAMELKPDEVQKMFKTLTVKSRIYGDFELSWDSDYGYRMTMPFDPDIAGPIPTGDVWTRQDFMSKLKGKARDTTFESLHSDISQMAAVKSLKQIAVKEYFFGKTLIAALDDKAFHSEADDIVRTVSMMSDVKKEIESRYAKR